MATIDITPKPASFYLQKNEGTRPPLISKTEFSSLWRPDYLGRVIVKELDRTSLVAQLMIQGNELKSGGRQIIWREDEAQYGMPIIQGNIISRTGNDFTFDATAIQADPEDMDANRPDEAKWIVGLGMNFWVADSLGVMNNGVITAISEDGKTITATPIGEGVSAWTIAETKLDLGFYGYNLKNCEFAPCIGYKNYSPVYDNTFFKDSVCVPYCKEDEIEIGTEGFDLLEVKNIGYVSPDERLNDAQRELMARTEQAIAFGEQLTDAQATALNQERGTKGLFTHYYRKMTKNQGYIETIDDLLMLTEQLRNKGVYSAVLRANNAQMTKLAKIITPTSPYYFSPFEDNTNKMVIFGFKGFEINGVRVIFQSWSALDSTSHNLAKKFNYIVIPDGKLTRVVNGKREQVGYLNIVWFAGMNETYKLLRDASDKEVQRGHDRVDYTNKFSLAVFGVDKFVVGVNV